MKKVTSVALIIIMLLATFTGCTTNKESELQQTQQNIEESTGVPIVDRAGNNIIIPSEINTIISMAPSMTEILIDLGYKDNIIAADTYSQKLEVLPEEIPFIDMMAPDAEQIIALNPDVIFASTMSMVEGQDPFKAISDLGICVVYIPSSSSIEEIYEDIIFMSDVLNVKDEGLKIVDSMKKKIGEIQDIGKSIENKKTVYFEIAAAPGLHSFGSGVFLDEMISIIGAENILGDFEGWIAVSEENVLAANPDVIITNVNYIENPVEEIKLRSGWENIDAVKNNDVYYVDNMSSNLPNHNIIKALEEIAKAVYPDKY